MVTASSNPALIAHRGLPPAALVKMLEDHEDSVVLIGLKGIKAMRTPGKPLHERLHYAMSVAKLFTHPTPAVRAAACSSLGSMSCSGEAFAWKVAGMIEDPDEQVVIAAVAQP